MRLLYSVKLLLGQSSVLLIFCVIHKRVLEGDRGKKMHYTEKLSMGYINLCYSC